jgi:hypothetical protein
VRLIRLADGERLTGIERIDEAFGGEDVETEGEQPTAPPVN